LNNGGSGAPSGNGYTKIYSNASAFAALKDDGSIKAWGLLGWGGSDAPAGNGYTKIYSNASAFAAVKPVPPKRESPHTLIEPSSLRATKVDLVE
jgi:hypothetical protein